MYVDAICISANTCRFSPVAVRLIKHQLVPGRASADLLKDFRKFLALFKKRTMPGRPPMKSSDLNFKPQLSGAQRMSFYPH